MTTAMPSRRRTKPDLDRAETLFHALSDATRLAILQMLRGGERCVCDLQDELDAAQSKLSFHLKVLKDAGLVTDRRSGRWVHYSLDREGFAEVEQMVSALKPSARQLTVRDDDCC